MRPVLFVALAALVGVIAFLVLGPGTEDSEPVGYAPSLDAAEDEIRRDPMLRSDASGRPPPEEDREPDRPAPPTLPQGAAWLAGAVLDDTTGRPVEGATVRAEPSRTPCPRPPARFAPEAARGATDAEGRFALERDPEAPKEAVDLFVMAEGYVTGCLCGLGRAADLVVRLAPAERLGGRVTDPAGRPLADVAVRSLRPGGLPGLPGTNRETTTDAEGRFILDGLSGDPVVLALDHPHYIPRATEALEPGTGEEHVFALVPAWRLSFRLRTDDGEPIENPTIQWTTSGDPPVEDLQLLAASPVGPPARPRSEVETDVVRIPTDRRTVDIEVKADGYHPWVTRGEPLPPDGGERLFQVALERDMTIGTLRLHLEDAWGEPVHWVQAGAVLDRMTWLGRPENVPTAYVMEPSKVLELPSMKAGRYRIRVAAPDYGPAEADVEVPPGRANDVTLTLGPPARLRVRFRADRRVVVTFLVLEDGQRVRAFPEDAEGAAAASGALAAEGGEGLVVTGLGGGPHTIQVVSENLVPVTRTVTLEPGRLTEVEIEVEAR